MDNFNEEIPYGLEQSDIGVQKFFIKVFGWMFLGLLTTALVSVGLFFAPYSYLEGLLNSYIIIVGIEVVLVFFLSAKALSLSPSVAKVLFLVYACMNGLMVMMLTVIYGAATIILAFGISCIFFATLAFIGFTTKSDISKAGPILIAALISLLILSIVNMFIGLEILDFALCIVGLLIFLGLTVYDVNKLKNVYYSVVEKNPNLSDNIAIFGALSLYLDFINIFVRIVRILGRRD